MPQPRQSFSIHAGMHITPHRLMVHVANNRAEYMMLGKSNLLCQLLCSSIHRAEAMQVVT